jgi:hypothetical protein
MESSKRGNSLYKDLQRLSSLLGPQFTPHSLLTFLIG